VVVVRVVVIAAAEVGEVILGNHDTCSRGAAGGQTPAIVLEILRRRAPCQGWPLCGDTGAASSKRALPAVARPRGGPALLVFGRRTVSASTHLTSPTPPPPPPNQRPPPGPTPPRANQPAPARSRPPGAPCFGCELLEGVWGARSCAERLNSHGFNARGAVWWGGCWGLVCFTPLACVT
jgi:hypothetical protein